MTETPDRGGPREATTMTDRDTLKRRIREYLADRDELLSNAQFAEMEHPLAGHCYVASEALFHATGGYDEWYVCRVEVATESPGGYYMPVTHWFLEDRETGEYVDLTAGQFPDADMDERHEAAVRTGFMTKQPSHRAGDVLDAVAARERPLP